MDSKQTDKNTNKRTNEEKSKTKQNKSKTKQKQNKTKQKTSKLNKEWLLKKKKKNQQPKRRMAIEWKFNVLSQSRKEMFPETIYLSWQLFYAIFLAKTALLVYSCTSFLAQL